MSDSGRQMGDCRHGYDPEWCVTCLRIDNARLIDALEEFVNSTYFADAPDAHEKAQPLLIELKGRRKHE